MGCGASSAPDDGGKERGKNYEVEKEDAKPKNEESKGKKDDSPKKSPRGKKEPPPPKPPPHTETFVCAQGSRRLEAKVEGAKDGSHMLLSSLQRGDMVLLRGCPEDTDTTTVNVWLDSSNVTLNVGGEGEKFSAWERPPPLGTGTTPVVVEVKKKKKKDEPEPEEEIVAGVDLLKPRVVAAEVASWEVRNFIGHAKTFKVLALAPSGQMCVSCDSQSATSATNFPMKCIDCNSQPPAICGQLDSRRRGPHGQIHDIPCDVQFSPDGNLLTSLHETSDVLLWDTNTFRVKRALSVELEDVCEIRLLCCSWSSDAKYIVFGGDYTTDEGDAQGVHVIIDLGAKGKDQVKTFYKGHGATCISVTYSPDGKFTAVGDKAGCISVRAVDAEADADPVYTLGTAELGTAVLGSPRQGEPTPAIKWLHYRHDGLRLLSGCDNELTLYDMESGEVSCKRTVIDESGDAKVRERFSSCCFAPGGWMLSGVVSRFNSRVVLYNENFEEVFNFRTKAPPACISNSRARACVGDFFGNCYVVDWQLRPKPGAEMGVLPSPKARKAKKAD